MEFIAQDIQFEDLSENIDCELAENNKIDGGKTPMREAYAAGDMERAKHLLYSVNRANS